VGKSLSSSTRLLLPGSAWLPTTYLPPPLTLQWLRWLDVERIDILLFPDCPYVHDIPMPRGNTKRSFSLFCFHYLKVQFCFLFFCSVFAFSLGFWFVSLGLVFVAVPIFTYTPTHTRTRANSPTDSHVPTLALHPFPHIPASTHMPTGSATTSRHCR
jgi:hypothetical protein